MCYIIHRYVCMTGSDIEGGRVGMGSVGFEKALVVLSLVTLYFGEKG